MGTYCGHNQIIHDQNVGESMNKKKIVMLLILLIGVSIGIRVLDLKLRYSMSCFDYYKYNGGLSVKEKEYLKENSLLVGVYNDTPLSFINEFNNNNAGIVIDYLSQLAIELGDNIHLKAGVKENLSSGINKDEIDIVVMERTAENKDAFEFSSPLCVVSGKIAVKNNSDIYSISDLENKNLATLKNDNSDGRITSFFKGKAHVNIIEVENMYQCFALIRNNVVVGFVGDDMEVAHFLNVTNRATSYKFLDPVLYEKEMSLAVKKGNVELLSILNKGILELKKKNLIVQTQRKWLGDFDSYGVDLYRLELTYKILSAILLIVAFFSSWNYVITQRVNTKTRELSESKAELRLIIDTLQRGIMVIENESIIVECNDAVTNLVGISRDELVGRDYNDIEILKPFVDDNHMDELFNQGDVYYYITSQKFENNKKLIMIEDYTEKYFAERRARQESKMIAVGQLSAGLAHEIRNPLGLIKSYVYIIESYFTDEIYQHAIFVINDSVGRINNLIENLLRFSKLSNDEKKLVDIENLVDMILTLEEKNLEKNEITVSSRVTGTNLRPIELNEDVIKMILMNLINNSIDSFAGVQRERKKIDLDISVEENELFVKIADNGCGIERDKLENIFNPFYSTKESGTGLGLYVISTEIANNEGRISVESELGQGTEFCFALPLKRR